MCISATLKVGPVSWDQTIIVDYIRVRNKTKTTNLKQTLLKIKLLSFKFHKRKVNYSQSGYFLKHLNLEDYGKGVFRKTTQWIVIHQSKRYICV